MESFSHYVGVTQDFVEFMGVAPRPATPSEASADEGIANVYEIEMEPDLQLKALHTQMEEGGDENISVKLIYKGRAIFSQSLNCAQIIVDKLDSGEIFLVLCQGSTNLHIYKNPWRLYVDNSTYYEDTTDSDY